jgi:hypothetical protein
MAAFPVAILGELHIPGSVPLTSALLSPVLRTEHPVPTRAANAMHPNRGRRSLVLSRSTSGMEPDFDATSTAKAVRNRFFSAIIRTTDMRSNFRQVGLPADTSPLRPPNSWARLATAPRIMPPCAGAPGTFSLNPRLEVRDIYASTGKLYRRAVAKKRVAYHRERCSIRSDQEVTDIAIGGSLAPAGFIYLEDPDNLVIMIRSPILRAELWFFQPKLDAPSGDAQLSPRCLKKLVSAQFFNCCSLIERPPDPPGTDRHRQEGRI